MKSNIFIQTVNYQRLTAMCDDLLSVALGVEMAAVVAPAGRGKTIAAERLFSQNPQTVYILYQEDWSYTALLREIVFRLCGTRPRSRERCVEMIQNDLATKRRVIMIDEADRMNLKCLNVIRNLHDICKNPIMLIGEEDLKAKLMRERRLTSRVRSVLDFEPATQADITVFYMQAIGQRITPEQTSKLLRHSHGDFRNILTDALSAERKMKASGLTAITDKLVDEVIKG